MAVLDNYPGLKVEVLVNGLPLQEYFDEDQEATPTTASNYVEATSGKGHVKRGPSFQKDEQWYRQHYRFTALDIVKESRNALTAANIEELIESKGLITIYLRFISGIGTINDVPRSKRRDGLLKLGAIPEKALKGDARLHQATLGKPLPVSKRMSRISYTHVDDKPFATFHFKYRSLSALKALRIISDPADVDLTPLEDRPEDTLTPDELREALRRLRRRDGESQDIKQEPHAAKIVKREYIALEEDDADEDVTVVQVRSGKRPRGEAEFIVLD